MLTLENAITLLLHNLQNVLEQDGFAVAVPAEAQKGDLPVRTVDDHTVLDFHGAKGDFRIEIFGNQALLYVSDTPSEQVAEENLQKISTNFFDLDSFDEKEIKSLSNEFAEAIDSRFGEKAVSKSKKIKTPAPVSRTAVRNGNQSYDANTLANRLLALYPQLKPIYQENFEKYGDFMAEEFFDEHATPLILNTIRNHNAKECNKLFRILNDIYESGLNDTQSLIAVTILGRLENNAELLATAGEYMCEDMREPVLYVNKYLYSRRGKKDLEKLKNPPPYKPKKKKEPGMFAQAMAASGVTPPPIN